MVQFIDDHRSAHGVEPICGMLPIAPATYYGHPAKRAHPARLLDRAKSDEAPRHDIQRVFLLEPIGNIPHAEAGANFYADLETEPKAA